MKIKKFEKTWIMKRLRFRQISPFWNKWNFLGGHKKFRTLKHLSMHPTAKFYLKRRKWDKQRLKAYINVEYDI